MVFDKSSAIVHFKDIKRASRTYTPSDIMKTLVILTRPFASY